MGRRALRKIDPALDLSCHLQQLDELPCPLDAAALFPRIAPLELELGSGKGLFLSQASRQSPDRNFLGIEIVLKYARFAAAKLAKQQVDNAVIVCGDGQRLFRDYLTDAGVDVVHVYFPDPWWKKRHHKRRLMNETFLRDVQRVLVDGGKLVFWTDVQPYFDATLELIEKTTRLVGPLPSLPYSLPQPPAADEPDYRTHFERRMRLHGQPVYRAEFRKET